MKPPFDRDAQIELMTSTEERHKAHFSKWMRVPLIREAVQRPAPGQKSEEGYTQHVESRRLARCG